MDTKKFFMRKHSTVVRKWSATVSIDSMQENPACYIEGSQRIIMVTLCRIKQRILSQAWEVWVRHTEIMHDYREDVRMILSKHIPHDDLRSELEIEVLHKWILQVKDIDPTGIAGTIHICKKRTAVFTALQQLRLETYSPGEPIIFQGDVPKPEDGHFTILTGECEVLQFPDGSVSLTKLQQLSKSKKWDEAKQLLLSVAQVVAKIPELSGFGELSTLTGVKRAASVLTSRKIKVPVELLVLPKLPLLDCLKHRPLEFGEVSTQSEAIDFLRQSGLANRISPKDLVMTAASMKKSTYLEGEVLYYKGEVVDCIHLIVSGEVLVDVGDYLVDGKVLPFVNASADHCYHLTSGSILGDEGVIGSTKTFESTAAVVSSAAVIFEARGFGMNFIAEKMGYLRYTALYYRDKLRWDFSNPLAEQINPFTFMNSLRKIVGNSKPFRGTMSSNEISTQQEHQKQQQQQQQNQNNPNKPWSSRSGGHQTARGHHGKNGSHYASSSSSRTSSRMNNNRTTSPNKPQSYKNSLSFSLSLDIPKVSNLPKRLSSVGLHRALEINRICKRNVQVSMKMHAKENILYEQLDKDTKNEEVLFDEEIIYSESLFNKSVKAYYERSVDKSRKLAEEEEIKKQSGHKTPSAIRFFNLGGISSYGGGGADEQNLVGEDRKDLISPLPAIPQTTETSNRALELLDRPVYVRYPTPKSGFNTARKSDEGGVVDNSDPLQNKHTTISFQEDNILFINNEWKDEEAHRQSMKSKLTLYYEWLDSLHRFSFRQFTRFVNANGLNIYLNEQEIGSFIDEQELLSSTGSLPTSQLPPVLSSTPTQLQQPQHHHEAHHHAHVQFPNLPTNWKVLLKTFQRYCLNPLDEKLFLAAKAAVNTSNQTMTMTLNGGMTRPVTEETQVRTPGTAKSTGRLTANGPRVTSLEAVKSLPLASFIPPVTPMYASTTTIGTGDLATLNTNSITRTTLQTKALEKKANIAPDAEILRQQQLLLKAKTSYTPSSWKNDAASSKKIAEPKDSQQFFRPKTPDTRRMLFSATHHHHHHPSHDHTTIDLNTTGNENTTTMNDYHLPVIPQTTTASSLISLEQYIDSPDEFMQFIASNDLTNIRKRLEFEKDRLEWKTRFMTTTENNAGKEKLKHKKSILDSVRTHLKEDLSSFTKSKFLDTVTQSKQQNITRFIKTMAGQDTLASLSSTKEGFLLNSDHPTPSNPNTGESGRSENRIPQFSRMNSFNLPITPLVQLPSTLPAIAHSVSNGSILSIHGQESHSPRIVSKIEQSMSSESSIEGLILGQDALLPGLIPTAISVSFDEYQPSFSREDELAVTEAATPMHHRSRSVEGVNTTMISTTDATNDSPAQSQTSKSLSPLVVNTSDKEHPIGMTTNTTSEVQPTYHHHHAKSTSSIPTPIAQRFHTTKDRLSDTKPDSKALQAFEDFLSTQEDRQKINLEGRRKANKQSKFRIKQIDNHYEDLVSMGTTYAERLRTELAIFQALHPRSTRKDRDEFIVKFKSIYPDITILGKERATTDEMMELDVQSRCSSKSLMGFLSPPKPATPASPNPFDMPSTSPKRSSPSNSPLNSSGKHTKRKPKRGDGIAEEVSDEENEDDFELEAWQQYTVHDIVSRKTGERKTLPVVTLPKSIQMVTSKRQRSNRAQRGGSGVLVTLPAESEDLLIKGPPSYLELYKRGFRVQTSSKEKAKVINELKQRAATQLS